MVQISQIEQKNIKNVDDMQNNSSFKQKSEKYDLLEQEQNSQGKQYDSTKRNLGIKLVESEYCQGKISNSLKSQQSNQNPQNSQKTNTQSHKNKNLSSEIINIQKQYNQNQSDIQDKGKQLQNKGQNISQLTNFQPKYNENEDSQINDKDQQIIQKQKFQIQQQLQQIDNHNKDIEQFQLQVYSQSILVDPLIIKNLQEQEKLKLENEFLNNNSFQQNQQQNYSNIDEAISQIVESELEESEIKLSNSQLNQQIIQKIKEKINKDDQQFNDMNQQEKVKKIIQLAKNNILDYSQQQLNTNKEPNLIQDFSINNETQLQSYEIDSNSQNFNHQKSYSRILNSKFLREINQTQIPIELKKQTTVESLQLGDNLLINSELSSPINSQLKQIKISQIYKKNSRTLDKDKDKDLILQKKNSKKNNSNLWALTQVEEQQEEKELESSSKKAPINNQNKDRKIHYNLPP
ncbi:hypothetical protein PPERSA_06283 [Pseudocohnilembus persalinus]|uniref:Uncharacterized protein n=1 Tax=Pseudocohnilembus persalinus TaxID=266149 RepID=A0A0V0QWI8_PSEPJ|nr:hypothetical protein PPERSA_06283 [Pseudocohnilembus persalinus]|eukprot:KRX06312.1 hypothetical protein PPERSA_06283 [Pseudocohnilembus persalinus]